MTSFETGRDDPLADDAVEVGRRGRIHPLRERHEVPEGTLVIRAPRAFVRSGQRRELPVADLVAASGLLLKKRANHHPGRRDVLERGCRRQMQNSAECVIYPMLTTYYGAPAGTRTRGCGKPSRPRRTRSRTAYPGPELPLLLAARPKPG